MGVHGAVDVTAAFHWSLYLFGIEGFLFFAVVTQTKSQEPGHHGGVARHFSNSFLFSSLAALFLAVASQTYPSSVSNYFGVAAAACTAIVALSLVAAAAQVVVPEPRHALVKTLSFVLWISVVLLCLVFWSKNVAAVPDIPYVSPHIRRQLAGAVAGGVISVLIACFMRIGRTVKGRNGAFILMLGCAITCLTGIIWIHLQPMCDPSDTINWICPLPRLLDPNTLLVWMLFGGNILCAEGVLRLMSVGTGESSSDGYSEILP